MTINKGLECRLRTIDGEVELCGIACLAQLLVIHSPGQTEVLRIEVHRLANKDPALRGAPSATILGHKKENLVAAQLAHVASNAKSKLRIFGKLNGSFAHMAQIHRDSDHEPADAINSFAFESRTAYLEK